MSPQRLLCFGQDTRKLRRALQELTGYIDRRLASAVSLHALRSAVSNRHEVRIPYALVDEINAGDRAKLMAAEIERQLGVAADYCASVAQPDKTVRENFFKDMVDRVMNIDCVLRDGRANDMRHALDSVLFLTLAMTARQAECAAGILSPSGEREMERAPLEYDILLADLEAGLPKAAPASSTIEALLAEIEADMAVPSVASSQASAKKNALASTAPDRKAAVPHSPAPDHCGNASIDPAANPETNPRLPVSPTFAHLQTGSPLTHFKSGLRAQGTGNTPSRRSQVAAIHYSALAEKLSAIENILEKCAYSDMPWIAAVRETVRKTLNQLRNFQMNQGADAKPMAAILNAERIHFMRTQAATLQNRIGELAAGLLAFDPKTKTLVATLNEHAAGCVAAMSSLQLAAARPARGYVISEPLHGSPVVSSASSAVTSAVKSAVASATASPVTPAALSNAGLARRASVSQRRRLRSAEARLGSPLGDKESPAMPVELVSPRRRAASAAALTPERKPRAVPPLSYLDTGAGTATAGAGAIRPEPAAMQKLEESIVAVETDLECMLYVYQCSQKSVKENSIYRDLLRLKGAIGTWWRETLIMVGTDGVGELSRNIAIVLDELMVQNKAWTYDLLPQDRKSILAMHESIQKKLRQLETAIPAPEAAVGARQRAVSSPARLATRTDAAPGQAGSGAKTTAKNETPKTGKTPDRQGKRSLLDEFERVAVQKSPIALPGMAFDRHSVSSDGNTSAGTMNNTVGDKFGNTAGNTPGPLKAPVPGAGGAGPAAPDPASLTSPPRRAAAARLTSPLPGKWARAAASPRRSAHAPAPVHLQAQTSSQVRSQAGPSMRSPGAVLSPPEGRRPEQARQRMPLPFSNRLPDQFQSQFQNQFQGSVMSPRDAVSPGASVASGTPGSHWNVRVSSPGIGLASPRSPRTGRQSRVENLEQKKISAMFVSRFNASRVRLKMDDLRHAIDEATGKRGDRQSPAQAGRAADPATRAPTGPVGATAPQPVGLDDISGTLDKIARHLEPWFNEASADRDAPAAITGLAERVLHSFRQVMAFYDPLAAQLPAPAQKQIAGYRDDIVNWLDATAGLFETGPAPFSPRQASGPDAVAPDEARQDLEAGRLAVPVKSPATGTPARSLVNRPGNAATDSPANALTAAASMRTPVPSSPAPVSAVSPWMLLDLRQSSLPEINAVLDAAPVTPLKDSAPAL